MTSGNDGWALDALARGDVSALAARLDARTCPPEVVRRLIRHDEPRSRRLGLVLLADRLTAGGDHDDADLAEFAAWLPATLDGSPDTALALAGLYRRLRSHVRPRPWPRWRAAELPARVRVAWLSAEIADRPGTVRDEPAGELLYQAVRGVGAADVDEPETLVRDLSDRTDPVLRAEALRVAREAVHAALLAPALARTLVAGLAEPAGPGTTGTGTDDEGTDGDGAAAAAIDLAAAALRELAEPWAALDPLPRALLYRFLTTGPAGAESAVADAAIEAAARHGHRDLLLDVAADGARPPALRRRSLELLGGLAGRDDVRGLVEIAAGDPLLLAGPAVACLRGMHRRGHFPAGADVPAIVGLALADHSVPARELATLLYTCRRETLRELAAAAADDPSWPRRLELLVALAGQGTGELPVGDTVTGLLHAAPDPGPFLRAIRALRHTAAEEAVIAALPRSPAAALDALEAVGGSPTVTALREGLGLEGRHGGDTAGAVVSHLRPVRHRALELLWHLTEDARQRRSILVRLDPRELPRRIASDLGGPDERELALLSAGLDPDRPVEALCRLARGAGTGTVPAIADLLLRVVSDLAAAWAPDGPDGPDGEPVVPAEVVTAVRDLGGRLHERGRIRPRCLLDAADAREAGDALVADMTLELLNRPDLAPGEQTILLGLLLQVPYRGIRGRVHPLLRHRDRHVRKHAIALLARDADGEDAQALSASLISLTTAQDAQSVRQALLALGHARARWAAAAIAACLDHPNMNVKKTAATALARAGTPAAVPRLLTWLGRHDNPGLRDALVAALRAILGDAYGATVVAAADHADDERTRTLLLESLCHTLPARSVGALADQGSPAGSSLLALVAAGRVALGAGTVAELSDRLAAHGIAAPAAQGAPADPPPDSDLESLVARGWNTEVARRLVDAHERDPDGFAADRLGRLRPMLAHWLDLAETGPAGPALRFTLRLCPAPWAAGEVESLTRSVRVLVAGLADIGDGHRDAALAMLERVAPRLPAAEALDVAARIRALPPGSAGSRSALVLLRRCGSVLTGADLEGALAAARGGADPWLAEEAVLREAFGAAGPAGAPVTGAGDGAPDRAVARRWRDALEAAARTPGGLRRFRADDRAERLSEFGDGGASGHHTSPARDDRPVDSRDRLDALIGVFPTAGADVRDALLDWMLSLQPIDAPPWTIAEDARRPMPAGRVPRPGDLDQPRSAALRERLLAMLDDPVQSRRDDAAQKLLDWPEPEVRPAVLRAFLHGRAGLAVTAGLARSMNAMAESELRTDDDAVRERVARVAARLDPPDVERLIPLLLGWWEHGGPATRTSARRALRAAAPDVLAEALSGRLDAGAWGLLDLIAGVPLLRTPALTRTRRRLREEGRDDLADGLVLVEGPLRHPDAARQDAAVLAALRDRRRLPGAVADARRPPREELLDVARTGGPEQIRRALSLLAERHDEGPAGVRPPGADRDRELEELLTESLGHPEARVRLHAHRISRRVLDRRAYLKQTSLLLDDPRPDIVRSAVKTLCHATWKPAIPAVVGLLTHSHPGVRGAAADGLALLGAPAIPALRHAAGRARPDRRDLYTAVLEKIAAGAGDTTPRGGPR